MAKFSEKQIGKFLDYIGANTESKKKERNLYKILGIIPEVDDEGNRVQTPYEILKTPPQFRDGKEVPIVFAIKNRAKKVGHYSGSQNLFFYAHRKHEKEVSELEETLIDLKKKYKHALFVGNADEALSFLELIDSLTNGGAEEIMGSYYNYTMFYKRMKKQLLMDMFAHFFLTYFFRYRNTIKEGLLKKSGHFRPYFERESLTLSGSDLNEISKADVFENSPAVDFGSIKSITFENLVPDMDNYREAVQTPIESSKPDISNIISERAETVLKESSTDKTESSENLEKTEIKEHDLLETEKDLPPEERKSFIKIPKALKTNLHENSAPEEIQEKVEETKSFN